MANGNGKSKGKLEAILKFLEWFTDRFGFPGFLAVIVLGLFFVTYWQLLSNLEPILEFVGEYGKPEDHEAIIKGVTYFWKDRFLWLTIALTISSALGLWTMRRYYKKRLKDCEERVKKLDRR